MHCLSTLAPLALNRMRYKNCELVTIGSIIGGVAAQEIVKLVTHIFIPLDNLWVYDGIHGVAETFKE